MRLEELSSPNMNPHPPPEQIQRYAVYSLRVAMEEGLAVTRSFIVIKNGYDIIVRFTRLHEYAGIYAKGTYRPVTANPESKLYFICKMLNYALTEFGIRHVFDLTKPMLAQFFSFYACEKLPDGTFRSQRSVECCVSAVTDFASRLCSKFNGYMKLSKEELYEEETRVTRRGKTIRKNVPAFQAVGFPQTRALLREIPTKVMEILIPLAFRYAREIARRMGKTEKEQEDIYTMGLLHDIGKIGVPKAVINKKGKLTDEEFQKIREHPVLGHEILKHVKEFPALATGARWHHERYDGRGYPDGLSGTDIPEEARIICVADAYDAMTSNRAYSSIRPQSDVRAEVIRCRGSQFDPAIADIMVQMIDDDKRYRMRERAPLPQA